MRDIDDAKKLLRREKIFARKQLDPDFRVKADRAINERVLRLLRAHKGPVTAYATDGTEPDLREALRYVLERGMALYLPRYAANGTYEIVLSSGLEFTGEHWGIPEPGSDAPQARPEDLRNSLWLVPGVAFDSTCVRLGRGKGIYDRLLAEKNAGCIGIFYECQKCAGVPHADHDRPLDAAVTESAYYTAPGGTIPEQFRNVLTNKES